MTYFLSEEGREELKSIRVSKEAMAVLDVSGRAPVRQLACVPSEECGCPEELWAIDQILYLIHMEEDGSSEMFMFAGDFEAEKTSEARDISSLRADMFAWAAEAANMHSDRI